MGSKTGVRIGSMQGGPKYYCEVLTEVHVLLGSQYELQSLDDITNWFPLNKIAHRSLCILGDLY